MPLSMDQQSHLTIAAALRSPQISLLGEVAEDMLESFLTQLSRAERGEGDIVIEITTAGGDAEIGRRLVLEMDLARERMGDRRLLFLGKTEIYSAGVTLMSAFPVEDRYLTRDAVLLIHGRQLDETFEFKGPMRSSKAEVEALLARIELGLIHEEQSFRRLIEGSSISLDEITDRALHSWYMPAKEAHERGLIAALV